MEDLSGGGNHLMLGGDAPTWMYSTAPLATPEGKPVAHPTPGTAGHALLLSDQQVGVGAAPALFGAYHFVRMQHKAVPGRHQSGRHVLLHSRLHA